ncbi:MAG: hypothetical protein ACK4NV_09765, partial [Pannonibacter sp.]
FALRLGPAALVQNLLAVPLDQILKLDRGRAKNTSGVPPTGRHKGINLGPRPRRILAGRRIDGRTRQPRKPLGPLKM